MKKTADQFNAKDFDEILKFCMQVDQFKEKLSEPSRFTPFTQSDVAFVERFKDAAMWVSRMYHVLENLKLLGKTDEL